jgi:hypothetical protein
MHYDYCAAVFNICIIQGLAFAALGLPEGWGFQQKQSAYRGLGFFSFQEDFEQARLWEI